MNIEENVPHLRAPEGIRGVLTTIAVVIGCATVAFLPLLAWLIYGHPVVTP